jgi:hypothetical protein
LGKMRSAVLVATAVLVAGCGGSGGSDFGAGETSGGVVRALKAHGLPIGEITVFDASTDPSAGGGVELFASAGDAKAAGRLRALVGAEQRNL